MLSNLDQQEGEETINDEAWFREEITPALAELEVQRQRRKTSLLKRVALSYLVFIPALTILFFMEPFTLVKHAGASEDMIALILTTLMLLFYAGTVFFLLLRWPYAPMQEYKELYKYEVLPAVAKLLGDFKYYYLIFPYGRKLSSLFSLKEFSGGTDFNGRKDMKDLRVSKIVPKHDYFEFEDYFRGTYKGVDVHFSEVRLIEQEYKRGKNGRKQEDGCKLLFEGVFAYLDLGHTKYAGHTVIDYNRNSLGELLQEFRTDLKRANMVDSRFEDLIDVYTNDQVEARYMIDPIIIERLTEFYKKAQGQKMRCALYDEGKGRHHMKMLIMIETGRNFFEPPSFFSSAINYDQLDKLREQMYSVLEIVDVMNLENER